MDRIGVGVIGTGFGRTVHIPAFRSARGAALIGVASARYERAREVAAECSLPRAFVSWQEMVECAEIQAISIATPPALHEEISLGACAAGKAVLCEKPLALDVPQAARMLSAARSAGVVHFVGFELREIPALRFAKALVQGGAAGRLRHVNIAWIVQSWGDPSRRWSWQSDRAQGGGILGAFGVHVLDYVEWLLGPIRSLAAHLTTRIARRPDASGTMRPVSGEDCCNLLLELHDGTPVTLAVSNVAGAGKGHWIELYGEERSLTIGSGNLRDYAKGFTVWERTPGAERGREIPVPGELRSEQEFADGRVAPFASLVQRFVDAIRKEEVEARPSFDDGLRAQVLVGAAIAAHREGRWVDVPMREGGKDCQL